MFYIVRQPSWVTSLCNACVWDIPTTEKLLYLTFDDGPDPDETPFVLDELKRFGAKATFFCLGRNVAANPALFLRILEEGHAIGNHTWQHLDGWKTPNRKYYDDIVKAKGIIPSGLFRPPFGRTTPFQVRRLNQRENLKTIMWTITSGDFDQDTSPEKCFSNIAENVYPGAIVLMHDSRKASANLRFALPKVLSLFSEQGYAFRSVKLK
jgi:peptidoglycan-N-acetylglucosamine deacetylase